MNCGSVCAFEQVRFNYPGPRRRVGFGPRQNCGRLGAGSWAAEEVNRDLREYFRAFASKDRFDAGFLRGHAVCEGIGKRANIGLISAARSSNKWRETLGSVC